MTKTTTTTPNPFAMPTMARPAISITGRPLLLYPYTQGMELVVSNAFEEKTVSAFCSMTTQMVRRHTRCVKGGEEREVDNYVNTMLLQEEYDLMFLLYVLAYGRNVAFAFSCPNCNAQQEIEADITGCRRRMFECGNPECACHHVNKLTDEVAEAGQYHFWDFMEEHWREVDPDHLLNHPPSLEYRPGEDEKLQPTSRAAYDGAVFTFRLPTVAQKLRLTTHADVSDPKNVTVYLEETISRLQWPKHNIDTYTPQRERDSRREVSRYLGMIEEEALRLRLRSYLERHVGGFDSRVKVVCTNKACGLHTMFNIPVNRSFFLPQAL